MRQVSFILLWQCKYCVTRSVVLNGEASSLTGTWSQSHACAIDVRARRQSLLISHDSLSEDRYDGVIYRMHKRGT